MKKLTALFLVLLMLIVPFVSCADSSDDSSNDSDNAAGSETNTPDGTGGTTAYDEELLEIPDEKFTGEEFVILTTKIVTWNYGLADFDEPSDDPYENAFYERNRAVEEQLGITISQVEDNMGGDVYNRFATDVNSGTYTYDICFNNMPYSCSATGGGLCYVIDEMEYIDLDKAWWNDDASDQLSIGGNHYMIAGDIALSDKEGLWAIYFIKDYITQAGLENPYELVENNQWTFDKMHEMASAFAFDQDGDGAMTSYSSDLWGLCTHHENWAATWQSAGLKLIEKDENDIPYIAWGSEQFFNVFEKTKELMGDSDVVSPQDIGFISDALKDGTTLFANEIIAFVRDYRTIEHEFGILPYPKFNSDVPEYYSFIVTNCDVLTIPKSCDDTYKTSIITEALAAKGREILIPAYYDGQLKSRYSRDEESSAMLDIIFEHRSYDLGVFFDWGGAYSQLQYDHINPASLFPKIEKTAKKALDKSLSKLGL